MKMRALILGTILLFSVKLFAQNSESVLFTIGDQSVMASEFKYIYEKNNKNDENYYSKESVNEYLNLFINFKLKVKEAKSLGIDTTEAFLNEFNTYRDQLTKPYMTDKKTTESLVKEAYDRMKYEVRASHILILAKEDDDPDKILEAEKKIKEIYKRAMKGEDFAKLAEEFSEDPSVKFNKGDLGYFSAFHLIYDFENVAFNTPVGEISKPFKTIFGYHILKVTDKRPYQGQIKVAQIFVAIPQDSENNELLKAKAKVKIDSIYSEVLKDTKFELLVERHSDDARSKNSGGVLPEFTNFSYNIPKEFKEAAFALEHDGDISKPFETNLGYHIVKRISLTALQPFDEMEKTIESKVRKDSRSQLSETNMIAKVKSDNHFKAKKKGLKLFYSTVDSSLLKGNWSIKDPSVYNKELFVIGKETYTQLDFAKFMEEKQKTLKFKHVDYAIEQYYILFEKATLLDYSERHLEQNFPDFKNLVNEYKEGMMLFEITDKMVWTKAMSDTTGQKEYYEAHKDKYMHGERVEAELFICKNKEIANKVLDMVNQKKTPDQIANELNELDPLNVSYSLGTFEKDDNESLKKYFDKSGAFVIVPEDENANWKVANIKKHLKSDYKKFNEIRGIVIADFQTFLEEQWIKELKVKYPVKLNEDVLVSIIKNK